MPRGRPATRRRGEERLAYGPSWALLREMLLAVSVEEADDVAARRRRWRHRSRVFWSWRRCAGLGGRGYDGRARRRNDGKHDEAGGRGRDGGHLGRYRSNRAHRNDRWSLRD